MTKELIVTYLSYYDKYEKKLKIRVVGGALEIGCSLTDALQIQAILKVKGCPASYEGAEKFVEEVLKK